MSMMPSALDLDAMARARALLTPAVPRERLWPTMLAAVFFAATALVFAASMILAPPLVTQPVVRTSLH